MLPLLPVLHGDTMIAGLGTDIVDIDRVARGLRRFGQRYVTRILTAAEITRLPDNDAAATYLAGRFAAKEAAVKALGTGFSRGIACLQIEVLPDALGRPCLCLHDMAQQRMQELGASRAHVSISHERHAAVAVVILES